MQDSNNMLLKGDYPDALMRNKIIPGSQSLTSKKVIAWLKLRWEEQ